MQVILEFALVILVTDFFSGLLHWIEDSYGDPDYPLTGRWITRPNNLHHINPKAFTTNSWLHSAAVLLIIAGAIVLAAWAFGILSWQLLLFVAIGINANELHKWNHLPQKKRPLIVNWLQRARILQSAKHHGKHHYGTKDSHYCVITDFVNPPLEAIRFWRGLEWLILKVFGVQKRMEPSAQERAKKSAAA